MATSVCCAPTSTRTVRRSRIRCERPGRKDVRAMWSPLCNACSAADESRLAKRADAVPSALYPAGARVKVCAHRWGSGAPGLLEEPFDIVVACGAMPASNDERPTAYTYERAVCRVQRVGCRCDCARQRHGHKRQGSRAGRQGAGRPSAQRMQGCLAGAPWLTSSLCSSMHRLASTLLDVSSRVVRLNDLRDKEDHSTCGSYSTRLFPNMQTSCISPRPCKTSRRRWPL